MNTATREFIESHLNDDVRNLALQKFPDDVDKMLALNQIEARRLLSKKVPSWASNPDLLFPKHLPIEQCSSELTAEYKASIIEGGDTFVDLTGGLGVDSYFLSEKFKTSYYVENQRELCNLAEHNFEILGRNITVVNSDAESFLSHWNLDKACLVSTECKDLTSHRDNARIVLYLDPARRDIYNRKMVSLHDCSPDVVELQRNLNENHVETRFIASQKLVKQILIKVSPMLDISLITNELQNIKEIHIVAVKNECKEILIKIEPWFDGEIKYFCVDLRPDSAVISTGAKRSGEIAFVFSETSESSAIPEFAPTIRHYLYEPNAAIMKSGAFKLISQRFGIEKLHVNSHLYTSDNLVPDFPGRIFEIAGFAPFNKKVKKELLQTVNAAAVSVRNFPLSTNELRKNLDLKESDETFIFGTTMMKEKKVLVLCKKL